MKLGKLYDEIVRFGIKNDPRSGAGIKADAARVRAAFKKLTAVEKKYYDKERLRHPYADTRLLYGNPGREIRTMMVGIDMEAPELLLADRLREKGLPIDLVLAHHPEGKALSNLTEVMHLQKDMMSALGIRDEIANSIMDERIGEVARSLTAANHPRAVDAARLLDIPYICAHTAADNHVSTYLAALFDRIKPKKVKHVLGILRSIPEYRIGMEKSAGPFLAAGKDDNAAGRVFVDMTGGTEGSKKLFARMSQAGVSTIVGMHFSEAHYASAKGEHINLIIAGHIASDNLGMNLLLDNLERRGRFNVVSCSGFERVSRA